MKSKRCCNCGETKPLGEFYKDKNMKDGVGYRCKKCTSKYMRNYCHSKRGLITQIYGSQIQTSKNRNHPLPEYTNHQLKEWLNSQPLFHKLFDEWIKSGFNQNLTPSCDRLNDYLPYSFDNIRLTTWSKNRSKGHRDRRNGLNNKNSKAVIGVHEDTKEVIEFYSMRSAERETGIPASNICACCLSKGYHKSAGGYKWKHKEDCYV